MNPMNDHAQDPARLPSGESYSFQKIYAFPLLKHEKQEIFRSPAKGGQMNPMNDHAQDPARLPKPRRDYKDTLFRLLFRDRNRLLSLYNAVNGTSSDFCSGTGTGF